MRSSEYIYKALTLSRFLPLFERYLALGYRKMC